MKSGSPRFHNQVCWARQYLLWEGPLSSTKRGIWTLTMRSGSPPLIGLFMGLGGSEPEQSGDGLTDSISNNQAIRRSSTLAHTRTFAPAKGLIHILS